MTRRIETVEVRPPKVEWYLVGTALIGLGGYLANLFYGRFAGAFEGALAPAQLGSKGESANQASRAMAAFDATMWINIAGGLCMLFLWLRFGRAFLRYRNAMLLVLSLLAFSTGCGPAKLEKFEDIQDHETSFVVPMEGSNESQEKFGSKDFLQQNLVAAKRVSLPLRKKFTGRWPWSYEWIETARVITVGRTPQHREWIKEDGSKQAQVLRAQSSEGTKFSTGAVISALVTEDDAALFRSHFKNVTLETILDTTVRGFCQERVAIHSGKETLDSCQEKKSDIFDLAEKEAIEEFKKVGITVLYFGNYGGLDYDNKKVQTAIDSEYLQKIEKQIAGKKLTAQQKRNETRNIKAKADAEAARIQREAEEAIKFVNQIEIAKIEAQARLDMAKKVSGKLPETILPGNVGEASNMLLQLNR